MVLWTARIHTQTQIDHLLGDPKPGHNKKIQIVFITCLEILNLCNMLMPTIHVQLCRYYSFSYQRPALHAYFTITVPLAKITSDQIQHRSQNQRRKFRNRHTLKLNWLCGLSSVLPWTSGAKPGHFGVPKTTFGIPGQSVPNRDCPGKTGTVSEQEAQLSPRDRAMRRVN